MMIKNILFDLGGVIIDIDKTAAIKQFKRIGLSNIEDYLDAYRQRGIFHGLEEGTVSKEEFYEEICKLVGNPIDCENINKGWLDFLLPVKQEKLDFIAELRKQYKTLLLSNTNPIVMEWVDSADFSPAGKPLSYYFDQMFLSYKLRCMKPDPEIFHKVIEMSGIIPEETLFIDDSKANIDAGASFGLKTFWFTENSDFFEIKNKL